MPIPMQMQPLRALTARRPVLDACASNWKGGHTAVLSYRSSGRGLSVQGQGQGPGGADSEWSPSALSPKLVHFPAIRFAKVTCLKSEATASASESSGSHPMLPSPRAKPHPSVLLLCRYSTHPESCQPIHPAQLLWA